MTTAEDVRKRFNELLALLRAEHKSKIEALLLRHPLTIYVTDDEIRTHSRRDEVLWAATLQGKLYFRLRTIPPRYADFVLLHEMMHMVVEERDGVTPNSLEMDALSLQLLRGQGGLSRLQKIELEVKSLTTQEAERLEIDRPKNTTDDKMLEMLLEVVTGRIKTSHSEAEVFNGLRG
ncbi:MAG: hypothetical protein Q7S40_08310 [Opitutaceae bacterium]|nr:hypothetical protein [Opitutaceae bacterium]